MDLGALAPELVLAAVALALVPLAALARRRWSWVPTAVAALGLAGMVAVSAARLGRPARTAFCGTYAVDGLATVLKILLGVAALIALGVLHAYLRGTGKEGHAAAALSFSTLGGVLASASLDLALILLFLQLLSLAAYVLVALIRTDPRANEAALKVFVYGAVALAVMAYGWTFLFGLTGGLALPAIGGGVQGGVDAVWLAAAVGLVLVGYAFEVTAVPVHAWAPDVYAGASAPVAGYLSVVPKVAGFGALLRFLLTALPGAAAGWPAAIAVIAVATMTLGNLAALRQTRLKRLLAYSSIAQAGYVLVALAAAGASGDGAGDAVSAAVFYLAAYAFMNLGAFAVTAQVERATGGDDTRNLRGLGRAAPAPAAALALSLLSLAGIPPLAGFAGKVLVFRSALGAGLVWLVVVAAANMAVGLYVYLKPVAEMYLRRPDAAAPGAAAGAAPGAAAGAAERARANGAATPASPADAAYVAALAASVAGTVLLGVLPDVALRVTRLAAGMAGG